MMIKIFHVPRERDEMVLQWLELRRTGHTVAEIGDMDDENPGTVRAATNRVRDADLTESGESLNLVRRAYA